MANRTDNIKVKVIRPDSNHEIHFKVKQRMNMGKLKKSYSERAGVPVAFIDFEWRGRRICHDETPLSLDMDQVVSIKAVVNEDWRGRWHDENLRVEMAAEVAANLEEMLGCKELSDFQIVCEGEVVHCHRVILAARSSYFKSMFSANMVENQTGRLEVVDMDPCAVYAVVKFIYSGRVENIQAQAVELLKAADRYDLPGLKRLCENSIVSSLEPDNALDMFAVADMHNAEDLKEIAKMMIVKEAVGIVENPGWKEKLAKFPNLIFEIFEAVVKENKKRDRGPKEPFGGRRGNFASRENVSYGT